MKGIVCPVDFSPASMKAIEFATMLAEHAKMPIHLYFTFTEKEFDQILESEHIGQTLNVKLAEIEKKLEAIAKAIKSEKELIIQHKIDTGAFPSQFLEYSNHEKFDYVIMGTTGMGQKGTFLPGSNTVDVLKRFEGKVFCIPENCNVQHLYSIVYASDLSSEDRFALQEVLTLSVLFKSQVDVVHFSDNPDAKSAEELLSFVQQDRMSYTFIEETEDIALGIENFVKSKNADLLVLFHKKRNIFAKLFHKSVTQQLAYFSDVPMLIIK